MKIDQYYSPLQDGKLNENQKFAVHAALVMISWARAVFAEKPHMPSYDPADLYGALSAFAVVGTLASRYRDCYRRFCEVYRLRPTEDYMTAVQKMEAIIKWLNEKTGDPTITRVLRCDGTRYQVDPWVSVTPLDMHTKIMAAYAEYRRMILELAKIEAETKTRKR